MVNNDLEPVSTSDQAGQEEDVGRNAFGGRSSANVDAVRPGVRLAVDQSLFTVH